MEKDYWFSKKEKKFLKNIDTFYYAVYFKESFLADDHCEAVEKLRAFCDDLKKNYESKDLYFSDHHVIFQNGSFSFYNVRFSAPDFFDFFVAPVVYTKDTPIGILQLRSRCLWEDGIYAAFDDSFEFIQDFSAQFGLTITDVRENRCDFACHSNYLSDPESFFQEEHFVKMWVGSCGRSSKEKTKQLLEHITVYDDDTIEKDYIAIGKRGDKCFIRIYLKSKEVIQEGYKGWFLQLWYLSGLISRYDLFCLEEAYKRKRWAYVDFARLEWALKNDDTLSDLTKDFIKNLLADDNPDINIIHKAAKQYTKPVTKIFNVEFQCMRDMSRSFMLIPKNEGVTGRVKDYLDNYSLIYDYLTSVTMRLVRTDQTDTNKSRRDNCAFWDRLRNAKTVDFKKKHKDLHLIRKYSSNMSVEVRKQRVISSLASLDVIVNKDPDSTPFNAAELMLSILNDNDIDFFDRKKIKLLSRNKEVTPDNKRKRCIRFIAIDPESDTFY